jgi:predicted transcriptional regulator
MNLMSVVLWNRELGSVDKLTLLLLVSVTTPKEPACSLSIKQISQMLSCSYPTVRKSLKKLQTVGAIRIDQNVILDPNARGTFLGANFYTVNYGVFTQWAQSYS